MTMTAEESREVAEATIRDFIPAWQRQPYVWMYEVDIQVELASRIRLRLSQEGRLTFTARHEHDPKRDMDFSRVTCEPYVKVPQRTRAIHPDIVIWSDSRPAGETFINSGRWPILWACEIKSSFQPTEAAEDQRRLSDLLDCGRAEAATQLIFIQAAGSDPTGLVRETRPNRLSIWRIWLRPADLTRGGSAGHDPCSTLPGNCC